MEQRGMVGFSAVQCSAVLASKQNMYARDSQ